MRDDLFAKSKEFSAEAMRCYAQGQLERFAVEAAIGLELAAKAYLCSLHPSLIAGRDFDSLLRLCGHAERAASPAWLIRTIGYTETIERVARLLPPVKRDKDALGLLAEARNGMVHIGSAGRASSTDMAVPFCRTIKTLCDAMDVPLADFFETHIDLANSLLSDALKEADRAAVKTVAVAREAYRVRYADLDERSRKAAIRAIESSYEYSPYDDEPIDCPVCGHVAKASGEHEMVGWDANADEPVPKVVLYVYEVHCSVCGLRLRDQDEVRAAGVTDQIEIAEVDPRDFYEPDYDPYEC